MKKEWDFKELNNIKLYKFVFPLLLMIEFVYHKLNIVFVRSLKEEEESIVKDDELLRYYIIVANEDCVQSISTPLIIIRVNKPVINCPILTIDIIVK